MNALDGYGYGGGGGGGGGGGDGAVGAVVTRMVGRGCKSSFSPPFSLPTFIGQLRASTRQTYVKVVCIHVPNFTRRVIKQRGLISRRTQKHEEYEMRILVVALVSVRRTLRHGELRQHAPAGRGGTS